MTFPSTAIGVQVPTRWKKCPLVVRRECVCCAAPLFPRAPQHVLSCTHTRVYACAEGASGILLHACAYVSAALPSFPAFQRMRYTHTCVFAYIHTYIDTGVYSCANGLRRGLRRGVLIRVIIFDVECLAPRKHAQRSTLSMSAGNLLLRLQLYLLWHQVMV